jgi:CRISPR-associated protein Csb2
MSLLKPATELEKPTGQILHYAFAGNYPSVRMTVAVAEAFRSAALSAFHAVAGTKKSFLLSGHRPDGSPDSEHKHAYYLPQPGKDGRLFGLLLISPIARFDDEHLAALRAIRAIQWNGPSTRIGVELVEPDDRVSIVVASDWVSATPYVPVRRYWGTHGKHHHTPEKQLLHELEVSLPAVRFKDVSVSTGSALRIRSVSKEAGKNSGGRNQRLGFWAKFSSDVAVAGPIALGHSCHFGLGLFAPAQEAPTCDKAMLSV